VAKVIAFMVRVKVHDAVGPEDVRQILEDRLDGIGTSVDVNCQYVLPDARAQAEAVRRGDEH
jgi:hypothetical protein